MSAEPRRAIKLMCDYFCPPLWEVDAGRIGPILPEALPLPEALRARLWTWAASYDAILNQDDPAASDFASTEARAAYEREGRALAAALEAALPGVEVRLKL